MAIVSTKQNFRNALAAVPVSVPYLSHGRDPKTGLDCIGMVLAVYKNAGINIDDLDVPYSRRDESRPDRATLMVNRLALGFVEIPKTTPNNCREGDVLVIGKNENNHLALFINGMVVEMTKNRIQTFKVIRVWEHVSRIFRHRPI